MTMLLIDGFDHDDAIDVWTVNLNTVSTTTPRTGTRCLALNQHAATYRDLLTTEEDDGITVGLAYMLKTDVLDSWVITLYEAQGATTHIRLFVKGGSRGWEVQRGDGTVLIPVIPNVMLRDTWHYIEMKVKIANSGGTVELRQDGATIGSYTGDTQNGGTDGLIDRVQLSGFHFNLINKIDDVYILNEQGSAPWNSFLGDTRCYPLYPNGNGNYSQLLGSDGNSTDNYLLVDEVGTPSTADYVGSATDGQKDSYTFEDMPVSVGTIRAVETRLLAAKTETGVKQIRPLIRRSATDVNGADHVLAQNAYVTFRDIFQLDPIAAAAWTISTVDATEFGGEVRP